MKENIKTVAHFVKDLFFPVFCLACKKEGRWLCPACQEKIKVEPQFFCPVCYRDNVDGRTCQACRPFSFLDGVAALASYENEIVAKLIQLLKYEYVTETVDVLETWMGRFIKDKMGLGIRFSSAELAPRCDIGGLRQSSCENLIPKPILVSVPLHRRRYLERGFNQAALLAKAWSLQWGLPAQNLLVRQRFTQRQVGLSGEERRKNLVGAFGLARDVSVSSLPSLIILVDDVFTTGSTLQAAARTLKQAGVGEVWGLTAARER